MIIKIKRKTKRNDILGYLRLNPFESLLHRQVKLWCSKVNWAVLRLNFVTLLTQCKIVTVVGKHLNFVTGKINLQHNVYLSWPLNYFRTFDESRYSHHLINFVWTALLLISKAKVEKALCDQFSVIIAARPIFGHGTLLGSVHASLRKLLALTKAWLCKHKKKKKTNRH